MKEQIIIKSFLNSRTFYEKYKDRFENGRFGAIGQNILSEIDRYYKTDSDASSINVEILQEKLLKRYPKNKDFILDFLSNLPDDVSEKNVSKLIREQEQETIAYELAARVSQNNFDGTLELAEKFITLGQETEENPTTFKDVKIAELMEKFDPKNLIPIYPSVLNDQLKGGLPRQSQVGVFARPDVGKSAFCVNLAVRMCEDGYKVLYCGNEDADHTMIVRALCRFTRVGEDTLFSDPEEYDKIARENGYENFMFKSMHPGTVAEIEEEIKFHRPDVVVVDQVRNLSIKSQDDSMTNILLKASEKLRGLAKRYNILTVLVTQAGDGAEGKSILNMNDVEYSNTGFAATLDLLIGIGQDQQLKMENAAMLSFPKNKRKPISPFKVKIDYERNIIGVEE